MIINKLTIKVNMPPLDKRQSLRLEPDDYAPALPQDPFTRAMQILNEEGNLDLNQVIQALRTNRHPDFNTEVNIDARRPTIQALDLLQAHAMLNPDRVTPQLLAQLFAQTANAFVNGSEPQNIARSLADQFGITHQFNVRLNQIRGQVQGQQQEHGL